MFKNKVFLSIEKNEFKNIFKKWIKIIEKKFMLESPVEWTALLLWLY
jgi:hypothetical protein